MRSDIADCITSQKVGTVSRSDTALYLLHFPYLPMPLDRQGQGATAGLGVIDAELVHFGNG